jgi:hypothetical protein
MINVVQFISLLGVSFFGTMGFIMLFWVGGIVRTNIVWFIAAVSASMFDDSSIVASVQAQSGNEVDSMNEVDSIPVDSNVHHSIVHPSSINVVNRRSSSVKMNGIIGGLPIRPVTKIYSDADRIRTLSSIRVCQLPVVHPSTSFVVIERRYEPGPAPTSDIFGP